MSYIPLIDDELCSECNNGNNYYSKEDDNNLYGFKKCYKDPIGYYLDMDELIYKNCYFSCEKCEIKGNNMSHNCQECNNNYPIEFIINNYSNCYQNCSYYYYFDENNNYYCTDDSSCPEEYPILNGIECKKNNENSNDNPNEGENLILSCLNNINNKDEEIRCYNSILKNIEDTYTANNYDTSKFDNGEDEIIKKEKLKVTLTTSQNQKNNLNSDAINIDLGECENSLRQTYNLTNGEVLYIKILEIEQEEMRIPKVEYDVYAKLNGENLTKLNLDSCKNNKISLFIPVDNVDNIDKLNSKSGYYNDYCYTATSDSGTDISLEERKNEYPSNAVCQDGCDFVNYDYNTKKAKCSCDAKESPDSFADMKIDKKKLNF